MIVKLTNSCRMGCKHCMDCCVPSETTHMTPETYEHVLEFVKKYCDKVIISGGEPTEHPDFFEFIMKMSLKDVVVLSNGLFLEEEDVSHYLALPVKWRISVDKRFYSKKTERVDYPNVEYVETVKEVFSLGRAKINKIGQIYRYSMCYDVRKAVNIANPKLKEILTGLQERSLPSIDFEGNVYAGQSVFCKRVGTVESSEEELVTELRKMRCDECKY